jgi:LmbE family N-acetylglucosaminyl deacetylase
MAAIQAHSDDVPLSSAGTVAKLVHEGYTGYLIRVTNDDMGDAPGLGLPGSIGEHVLRNEQDNHEVARALGLKKVFDLNYNNHRMSVANWPELESRLIFLIRLLKIDTVVTWDPWGDFEENPDHWVTARCVEAACWMAGRAHDYPEQFEAGLKPHAVTSKYYFARAGGQRSNRIVDISDFVDRKVDANRANRAKGPAGGHGAQLRAELKKRGLSLPLLAGDDVTADRQYIKEFVLRGDRERGKKYGVAYAEQFRYVGGGHGERVDDYIKQYARPVSQR